MAWRTFERPGYFGKKRDEFYRQYDEKLGKDNWRIMWQWNGDAIPYIVACQLYEDGYYADSFRREDLWKELASIAKDVYDHQESDTQSGLDYSVQNGNATHLQDIAIRRVMLRRGCIFEGDKLVQIRSHTEYWGQKLSPGKVPFHLPKLIAVPHLEKWWDYNSIEDFWQSNKILQVRE
ncbi:hypothetical protein HYT26_03585 [Candidatus Pacearchaeota archaeon]|nr:hypothetical protein [Candidatus Pacearchaeota archaeon]